VNEEIVANAAAKGGIDAADVADEERRKSLATRVLSAIAQGGGESWALGATGPLGSGAELDSDDVRALIREAIEQTASRGKAVIAAHAASYAVVRGPGVLRVLVTASPDTRANRDDLVVNTDTLSTEQAAELITRAASD
jgi:hypothetical protein